MHCTDTTLIDSSDEELWRTDRGWLTYAAEIQGLAQSMKFLGIMWTVTTEY